MATIDPALRIGSAALAVADLARSADFYERLLGLPLLSADDERAVFGADAQRPLLELTQLPASTVAPPGSTGLFHVAWLHPSRAALAETVRRIGAGGWRFDGASDHGVSEALYLSDPDGLGIEIYADRPRESWRTAPDGHSVEMYTIALDLDDLLAQASEPTPQIAPGTDIGHVHLKVADVERARSFYGDVLGFEERARIPSAAFLAAGGYHHHVGLNSWQSRGGAPAPDSAPGLRGVTFELPTPAALDSLERDIADRAATPTARDSEHSLSVLDADGQRLDFRA